MTYEEDVREALKQGPGSVRQIVERIPRASENGVRRALRRMEARGEARILRFERLTPYAYAPIWEAIV
nr:MAG TPA: dissimilatory sulfite reductase D [Caudoviricetes sp.]